VVRPVSLQKLSGRLRDEWIDVNVQQDAKEYFDFLIDILHEDLNVNYQRSVLRELTTEEEQVRESMPIADVSRIEWERWSHREESAISVFFAGQHASRLRCVVCRATSTRYEPFMSIAVEIPQSGSASLQECLRNYTKEEMLDEGEEWMCPRCKCRRQATKQILITRMPQILCLHLKRFSRVGRAQSKISTVIDFPLKNLDMGPFMAATQRAAQPDQPPDYAVTPPYLYEAYAVMRHHGSTMLAGHYTAMVRDKSKNVWVNFNDDRVRDVDVSRPADRLQTSEAYILFYERRGLR
jgi:ubiquitin carboxyl-terminal hydrolase 8